MKIEKHFFVEEHLQRSIVRHNGVNYVRIARWVKSTGELQDVNHGVVPAWRTLVGPDAEFAIISPDDAKELERCFVTTLIHQNVASGAIKPQKPSYRRLERGEILMEGDEFRDRDGWKPTKFAGCVVGEDIDGLDYRRLESMRSPEAAE
jgi:hypothetical protein